MSTNPFNEQDALARQVLVVFDGAKLIEQLRAFVAWTREANIANEAPSREFQRPSLEPNPWTLLTSTEAEYSTDAHITQVVRHHFPAQGSVPGLSTSRQLCLRCVRLSILHDSVLPNDYPQLTLNILDQDRVKSVWRDISGDWLTWRQVLEYDIKRLQGDADTQGLLKAIGHIDQKPNGLGQPGGRWKRLSDWLWRLYEVTIKAGWEVILKRMDRP